MTEARTAKPLLWDDVVDGPWIENVAERRAHNLIKQAAADKVRAERDAFFAALYQAKAERREHALATRSTSRRCAPRLDVPLEWKLCSGAYPMWLLGKASDTVIEVLGSAHAQDVIQGAVTRAAETFDRERGTPESWARFLAWRDLSKALRDQIRWDDYYKDLALRVRQGERTKTSLDYDNPPAIKWAGADRREIHPMLLRIASPEGFAVRTVPYYTHCQGEHPYNITHVVDPGAGHMHRDADHEYGYSVLCLGCFEKLGQPVAVHTNVKRVPTREVAKHDPWFTRNVGASNGEGADG